MNMKKKKKKRASCFSCTSWQRSRVPMPASVSVCCSKRVNIHGSILFIRFFFFLFYVLSFTFLHAYPIWSIVDVHISICMARRRARAQHITLHALVWCVRKETKVVARATIDMSACTHVSSVRVSVGFSSTRELYSFGGLSNIITSIDPPTPKTWFPSCSSFFLSEVTNFLLIVSGCRCTHITHQIDQSTHI